MVPAARASRAARVDEVSDDAGPVLVWSTPDPALLVLHRGLALAWIGVPLLVGTVVAAVLAGPAEAVGVLAVGVVVLGLVLVAVRRRYDALGWVERDDDLLVRRGVLVRRTSVVPYGRMQYVDVTAGPLDRRLGLSTVVLHTAAAATDARVPGLREADAARLRDRLAALGEARQAGV